MSEEKYPHHHTRGDRTVSSQLGGTAEAAASTDTRVTITAQAHGETVIGSVVDEIPVE